MKRQFLFLLFLILGLGISNNLFSQVNYSKLGSVKGKVLDKNTNQPIPYANVLILGTSLGASSDEGGNFLIKDVEVGFVRVVASYIGYKSTISDELQIFSNHNAYIVLKMEASTKSLSEINIVSVIEKSKESPISNRSISLQEIEKTPGTNRDISKAVQNLPGVAGSAVNRNDLIVRGGGPSENIFFLDEVEIPKINHFSTQGASGGAVGIINPDFIRQVDFLSGAFPASKGNALSSVMDIKQKEGSRDGVHFKGSIGASDLALTLDAPIKNNNLLLSYRRSYLQFLFSALGLPFLPSYDDIQLRYKWNINSHNELLFLALGAYDRMNLNTSIKNPTESQRYLVNYLPTYNQWSYTYGMVYKHYNENSIDMLVFSRNMLRNTYWKYPNNNETQAKSLDYASDEAETKFRYEKRYTELSFDLSFGANMRYSKYTNDTKKLINVNNSIYQDNYSSILDLFSYGLFIQAGDSYLNEKLKVGLGARIDGNSYSPLMNNLLKQFSPRISASYLLTENLSLNANVGYYTQNPSYTSMGYKDSLDKFVNKQSLKYISVNHYVIGLEYNKDAKLKASLESFYKQYDNYPISLNEGISLASKGNDFGSVGDEALISTGKGKAYGFEVLLSAKDIHKFNFNAVFTYFVSEFTDINDKFIPSSWDNRFILNLTASRSFKYNWLISARWRWIGGSPYTPIDMAVSSQRSIWDIRNQPYLDYNNYNSLRLGNYHQLDIRVDKEFSWKKVDITVYIDIQNIYNFKSESTPVYTNFNANGNPMIDETNSDLYTLRKLSSTSGTLLPTFGIIVYF